ncbi:MAG: flavodoxin family protein [Gracilibacteraceae bacterium]|nr:flavodoxin family protein [Gracilibacteraceae bacterium]
MRSIILMGSPRKNGNTMALLRPFLEESHSLGVAAPMVWLHDKTIEPCVACRTCQKDWTVFGCRYHDDVPEIFQMILAADLIVLATPIYSWYCTPPLKALLDRLVYGMNKYYGAEKGPSLWAGKSLALITTCGYPPEKGADLWESGIKRYCKHSELLYKGMLVERHRGYTVDFMNQEKEQRARAFARELAAEDPAAQN